MEYKKVENKAYNIHLLKTAQFKKIVVRINFKEVANKEKVTYRNMLSLLLTESTNKYPSKRLLDIEAEELYNVTIGINTKLSGNYNILSANATFLNEIYTSAGMNEKSLDFIFGCLFEPHVSDNKFNEQTYENAKNALTEDIESFLDVPSRLAFARLHEEMCPNSPLAIRSVGELADLENMTRENLYSYYCELLKTNIIDIFIVGDINIDDMTKLIKDKFKVNTIKQKSEQQVIEQKKYKTFPTLIKEQKKINQSCLVIGAKLRYMTNDEKMYAMTIYNTILGSGPSSRLFKEVREKHSLCYSISSSHSYVANLEYVSAGIDAKTFPKTLKLIKKELKNMENGQFSEKDIDEAKTNYLVALKNAEDTASGLINIYEGHEYLDLDLIPTRQEKITKVTKNDIIKVAKKVKLDTIFLLEGIKTKEEE